MLEANQIKTTLKTINANSEIHQMKDFSLSVKKTINNRESRDGAPSKKKSYESEVNTPINYITFN